MMRDDGRDLGPRAISRSRELARTPHPFALASFGQERERVAVRAGMALTRFLDTRRGLLFEARMPPARLTVGPLIIVIIHCLL